MWIEMRKNEIELLHSYLTLDLSPERENKTIYKYINKI